ncbi:MAG: hypothetical protein CVV15_10025 [Gammaproteobacteria bacterium HGW-Gammaproteobacteria-5]|nr:MAG: hypothetical protein CVV15_10025 [Gammaproteobacteria bacterium HGW-Gammaproteobacteria-5]
MNFMRNGLQWKVLTGLVILTVVTVGSQLWNTSLYRTSVARYTVLGEVQQLETTGEALLGRGQHYVNNAARDFESYARDVALFKRELIGDVARFDDTLKSLQLSIAAHDAIADDALVEGIARLDGAWADYRSGLHEQLGPDENEPRLEWGARFVSNNQPAINAQVHALVEQFQAATDSDSRKASASGIGSVLVSLIVTAIALLWFFFGVTQRIRATVTGCQRVASGDFGYQMPVGAKDELGQLAIAFNSLSSRTRLVLSLLDHLQRRSNLATSFVELARESAPYIPTDWLALIEVSDSGNDGTVRYGVSSTPKTALLNERVSLLGLFAQRDFAKASTTHLPDLRRHTVEHGESRLARELTRLGYQSALLVPLNTSNEWRGLLVFAHQSPGAFVEDQVKLMSSLAPMLANGLARNARVQEAEPALLES